MRITRLATSGSESGLVTDEAPRLSFALESDHPGEALAHACFRIADWETTTTKQVAINYTGPLAPHTDYPVRVTVTGTSGETAEATTSFRTGRLGGPWQGQWITDIGFEVPDKKSPVPMRFRYRFAAGIRCGAHGPKRPRWASTNSN
ncbi:hypothetical protein [Nocardia fusca]|uniref:Uncharacterized protein n=1 Tax=Nocardia fusca TaxID=941183 RepID=A0ABV3FGK9_9NOCA